MTKWIEAAYSTPGRGGYAVDKIVPHIAECATMGGVDATFTNGVRQASAHYCVDDNDVHQYVGEGDTAWAVGNWVENCKSISIEHVGTTANPPSRATLDRSAALMADVAKRYGWTSLILGTNVGLHKWYSATSCPATLDVDYLLRKANELLGQGGGEWVKDATGWWYRYTDGSWPANKWVHLDAWYWFGADGYATIGWQSVGGTWYHMDANCRMQTGWLNDAGKWYYLDDSGAMATGWREVGGTWYYLDASGVMQTGWVQVGGKWYYLYDSGAMAKSEVLKIGGKWYAFGPSGTMVECHVDANPSGALDLDDAH